ncbi:uncharacterized protein FOMMEDRAFT_101926 [Fomitiporia mediterranea MF3/22]|uniref:uncharacterized protein n=1 Tax=Fomitiporia mediterranea (strain MF3/22) TaxID=694068 RepID=UPI0004409C79|nr:uncharacterized protein FOMMEDRAFT_101926 [Fomitiporia mediterranea MF3/22]EJD08505.1 hypothetical protein FOMMEDRAFT_101926 [Fomitiporia mediterranea MF3/22]
MDSGNNVYNNDAQDDGRRNRLPSFAEVLARKTRPPVDLFMFYLFLQREGSEDILDFWLDVQQHENLCRAYFKDVRKSGRTIKEDWPQYWDYARRRGSIYGTVVGMGGNTRGGDMGTKRSTGSTGEMLAERERFDQHDEKERAGERSTSPRSVTPGMQEKERFQATSPNDQPDPPRSSTPFSLSGRISALHRRASRAPTIIPRTAAVSRMDLIASAERIYFRYLSPPTHATMAADPSQNHEIYLPPALRIHSFMLSSTREPKTHDELNAMAQIPDMFHAQKEYCFRAMEQDAYPRFLRAKAFGNLTPVSALVRLVLGLIILWIGLAVGFSLIFLDVKPKSKRFFLFIPFTLAILFLISHQYELDPVLVFLGQSETTPFRTLTIREPYVKKLLLGRAIWVTLLVTACVAGLTLLFWAVPGHRL